MNNIHKLPKNDCLFLLPNYFPPYLDAFIKELFCKGYTEFTIGSYYSSIVHFGIWLKKKSIPLKKLNAKVLFAFSKHHCNCPKRHSENKISYKYVGRIRRFIFYLRQQHVIFTEKGII